jgi:hypothetical protein
MVEAPFDDSHSAQRSSSLLKHAPMLTGMKQDAKKLATRVRRKRDAKHQADAEEGMAMRPLPS